MRSSSALASAPMQRARALLARALTLPLPLVLDADALNLIAARRGARARVAGRAAPTAVTPHPAEAARLLATTIAAVRERSTRRRAGAAAETHAAVVVKGGGSVLAYPDGEWAINSSGNPGLASGGTGDVLAGMLGALLAQGIGLREALEFAVCLHGAAADALVAAGVGPLGYDRVGARTGGTAAAQRRRARNPSRRLRNEQGRSGRLARLEIAVRLRRVLERVGLPRLVDELSRA